MLEKRHLLQLKWYTRYPACGPEGNYLDAHVDTQATIHDCINMSRLSAKNSGFPTIGNDADFLLDFIDVNCAKLVVKKGC